MKVGGNDRATAYFAKAPSFKNQSATERYTSRIAEAYKKELERRAVLDEQRYLVCFEKK